jgi:two-component system response regulator RegA
MTGTNAPPSGGSPGSGAEDIALSLRGLPEAERRLLIVDDDAPFCQRLARAMEKRGFVVETADSVAGGIAAAQERPPAFAVVDLRLSDGSGLDVVSALRQGKLATRIVMLTGYGNIATAVAAVKAGAIDYLPKPADADQVEHALLAGDAALPPPPADPMSADRVRWEHIQRVFEQCERNVSETARRLKMHRRTLQRMLSKHAPKS